MGLNAAWLNPYQGGVSRECVEQASRDHNVTVTSAGLFALDRPERAVLPAYMSCIEWVSCENLILCDFVQMAVALQRPNFLYDNEAQRPTRLLCRLISLREKVTNLGP